MNAYMHPRLSPFTACSTKYSIRSGRHLGRHASLELEAFRRHLEDRRVLHSVALFIERDRATEPDDTLGRVDRVLELRRRDVALHTIERIRHHEARVVAKSSHGARPLAVLL